MIDNTDGYDMSYEACMKREAQRQLWNIEDWLLRTAGSKEEAQKIAQYLTTVNWDQTIIRQEKDKTRWEENEKTEIQKTISEGGGYCDHCHKLANTLLVFSHPKISAEYKSSYEGNLCISCLNRAEKSFGVPVDEWTHLCDKCYKPFPSKELSTHLKVKYRWYGYCNSCFIPLLEEAHIICIGCGEHTLEYTLSKSVCNTCYAKYPKYWTIVKRHLDRAISAGTPATLTIVEWENTMHHFNHKCAYCNKKGYQVLEHYMPISLQGGTTANNCIPACHTCNITKGDSHPNDFERIFPPENIARIKAYFATC